MGFVRGGQGYNFGPPNNVDEGIIDFTHGQSHSFKASMLTLQWLDYQAKTLTAIKVKLIKTPVASHCENESLGEAECRAS
jgi:hypothetical protein